MSSSPFSSETFILRLVRVEQENIALSLRSSASGEQLSFGSVEELAVFLKSITATLLNSKLADATGMTAGEKSE
ncbi:MAG: hypothetical protein IAF08_16765 [Rhizobacter sp.]|nr:hypothetical protein [Chlorobiales bacterium]